MLTNKNSKKNFTFLIRKLLVCWHQRNLGGGQMPPPPQYFFNLRIVFLVPDLNNGK
jgi:hypothetical protein